MARFWFETIFSCWLSEEILEEFRHHKNVEAVPEQLEVLLTGGCHRKSHGGREAHKVRDLTGAKVPQTHFFQGVFHVSIPHRSPRVLFIDRILVRHLRIENGASPLNVRSVTCREKGICI